MLHRIALVITALILSTSTYAQQKIVLRSLEEIESAEFRFDRHQIISTDGQIITWDKVFSGTVAQNDQQRFNQQLREIGVPLFRIRHRLMIGDFESLNPIAQKLQTRLDSGPTTKKNCRTRFILNLAELCGSLGTGSPEQATVHLLTTSELLAEFGDELRSEQMPQGLTIGEVEQCFVSTLLPIWFDRGRANIALEQIQLHPSGKWKDLSVGGLIYASSLAIASQRSDVKEALDELGRRSSTIKESWLPLLSAYHEVTNGQPGREVAELRKRVENLEGAPRAVAQYLLGIAASSQKAKFDEGMLHLLYVPAVYGEQLPHLSAAALFEASKLAANSGNLSESKTLHNELKNRYPNSQHAKRLQLK